MIKRDITTRLVKRTIWSWLIAMLSCLGVAACDSDESATDGEENGEGIAGGTSQEATDGGAASDNLPDGAPDSPDSACTRESLSQLIDHYFESLTAHDPSGLPVAEKVKFTENGEVLELGQGFWQTAGALKLHRNLLDPEVCGSLTQAVLEEEGKLIIFGLRLKLEALDLVEIETLVVRSGPLPDSIIQSFNPQVILDTPQPEWEQAVPIGERNTREELIAVAEAYCEGFETSGTESYVPVPFAVDCNRWENGVKTTEDNCEEQFETIPFGAFGSGITRRRYPVADVENGIAVVFGVFSDMGIDFHMFKVTGGLIHTIQAVVASPFSGSTGWEEYEID